MAWRRKLEEAMLAVVTPDDMQVIMREQARQARGNERDGIPGDLDAAKFVFEYCIGKPTQRVETQDGIQGTQKTYLMLPIDTDPDAP